MAWYGTTKRYVRARYSGFKSYDNGADYNVNDDPVTALVTDSRSGVSNPHYKAQIAAGTQAGTPFSGTKTKYVAGSFHIKEVHPDPPDPSNPYHPVLISHSLAASNLVASVAPYWDLYYPSMAEPSEAIANNEALTKFVRNVREAQTAFQGGTFLGELTKTLALIRNPARSLRQGVSHYLDRLARIKRREKRSKWRRSALADMWLEYAYAWTPLLLDSYDAIELLNRSYFRPKTKKVQGVGKHETVSHDWNYQYGIPGHSQVSFFGSRFKYYQVIYRGAVGMDFSNFSGWANQGGISLSNWIPTAWELMPYSFLIDYFANIGDIISAATLNRASLKWVMRTERYSQGYRAEGSPTVYQIASTWPIVRRDFTLPQGERVTVNRAPYYGSLVPRFDIRVPGFGLRWLNMAALARNHRALLPFF